jgi:putative membrane protein
MMWNGWGSGPGWIGWLAMTLSMVVFWGGLILLVIWAARQFSPGSRRSSDAQAILEERFARGEIDREEFDRRKAALQVR